MKVKSSICLFLVLVLTAALIFGAYNGFSIKDTTIFPGAANMRMGLDIAGGVRLVYKPVGENITDDGLNIAQSVFRKRLDIKGLNEATVTIDETNPSNPMLIVEIPGFTDPNEASGFLGKTAKLQFVEPMIVETEHAEGEEGHTAGEEENNHDSVSVAPDLTKVVMEGADIVKAEALYGNVSDDITAGNQYFIQLQISEEAKNKFAEATERLIGQPIFIMLDDEMLSAPTVQSKIDTSTPIITGNFSQAEAQEQADLISSGALPFSLEVESQQYIGPTIGHQAFDITLKAGMIALLFVATFLIAIYRLPGFISVINLALYSAIYILIHQWGQITLTLPGIAGMILSIAMAVDSSVIIYERLREELNAGKTLKTAVDLSFGRAFTAIRDANFTTIISSLVLWYFGTGPVQGFAIALFIGTILSLFMSMIALRLMMKNVANIFPKGRALYGAKRGGLTNEN